MANTVPVREMKVYQTDDGRRVEVFSLWGSVDIMKDSENKNREFSKQENIYIGVAHIMTDVGPKEIKFEILGVNSIDMAFDGYYEIANKAVEEMKKRWEQQQEEENKIITVPANALNAINESQENEGSIII